MKTYELEIHKVKHFYYRETIQAKSRAEAMRMLQTRLDLGMLEFVEDEEEIVDAQAYKVVSFER
jgi:hypothetical protein